MLITLTSSQVSTMTTETYSLEMTDKYSVDLDLTARVFLTLLSLLTVICGTVGNFLVWYGSMFRSAIRMEPCSRVLITNLALSDMVISLLLFLPLAVTLGAGRWVLGDFLCQFQGVAIQIAVCLEIFIMMSLNCYRLWAVRKTPGDRDKVKVWQIYCYLGVVLLVCGSLPLVHTAISNGDFRTDFDYRVGICRLFLTRDYKHNILDLCYLVPPLVISITASKVLKCILCYSSQRSGSGNPKTQRAISLVCWAMIISYLPCYIILVWEVAQPSIPNAAYLARAFIMSINLMANPLIYFIYSSSFNRFVRTFFSLDIGRERGQLATDPAQVPETSKV